MNKLIYIEIIGLVGATMAGVTWIFRPDAGWEPLFAMFCLVSVVIDLVRRILQHNIKGRFASNSDRVKHREKLRKVFREEILHCRAMNLRQDVIVRHVDRMDAYPQIDKSDIDISPWFRVALLDTYERGIVLGLRIGGLVRCDGGFRFNDHINGEKSDITAFLMGDIPYDSIVAVNMEGDEYYNFPHIYCNFDFSGEPYERKWFCEKINQSHGHPYFKLLAEYEDVISNNPMEGTLNFA